MTTYYNGCRIKWLDSTFKIGNKEFETLRGAMDYVDGKRCAQASSDTDIGDSESRADAVHD